MKSVVSLALGLISLTSLAQTGEIRNEYMWGKVEDGLKTGVWQYYDNPDELSLIVNYSTDKLIFVKKDSSLFPIRVNGDWISSQVVSPPRYLGSWHSVTDHFNKKTKYPDGASIPGIVKISFVIDELGNAGEIEVEKELYGGYATEVIKVLNELPNTWLPAITEAGPAPSKMMIIATFGFGDIYQPTRKEFKKYPELFVAKPYLLRFDFVALGIKNPPKRSF